MRLRRLNLAYLVVGSIDRTAGAVNLLGSVTHRAANSSNHPSPAVPESNPDTIVSVRGEMW